MSTTPEQARNVEGATTAITTISALRPWGRVWLPVLFAVTRRFPSLTRVLRDLQFIHFARWSVIRQLPHNGPGDGPAVRLRYPHMLFESNFNADPSLAGHTTTAWDEYIEAFSNRLARGMRAFWGSSYGFPGALPVGPFKRYIRTNEYPADVYYSAYPAANTSMIVAALKQAAAEDRVAGGPIPAGGPNVSGQAYAFTALTPITPGQQDALTTYLRGLGDGPFARLPRTHMARLLVIEDWRQDPAQPQEDHLPGPYLLFTSNFDGDLGSYLRELAALPGVDHIWSRCVGYDFGGDLPAYLERNQITTGLFYAPYGDATVADVKDALKRFPQTDTWTSDVAVVRVHVARAVRLARESYQRYLTTRPPVAVRDQHPRAHGCIRGTLRVRQDLPDWLRYGIGARPGAEYQVVARFSANAPARLPWGRDAHGLALKIIDVQDATGQVIGDQDLILANTQGFFAGTAQDAVELIQARNNGGRGLLRYFVAGRRWRELRNMLVAVTRFVADPLRIDYYSPSALAYGPANAGKFTVRATDRERYSWWRRLLTRPDQTAQLGQHIAARAAAFDLEVTIRTKPSQQPVDDPRVAWPDDPPADSIGRLDFAAQQPTSGEELSFSLAHHVAGHETVDQISEVRKAVYALIFDIRSSYNAPRATAHPAPAEAPAPPPG